MSWLSYGEAVPANRSSPYSHGRSEVWERPGMRQAIEQAQRKLGLRLRALREEQELTQEVAAEAMAIHVTHLQRIEAGCANVTLATLVAASVAYRVSVAALFEGSKLEKPSHHDKSQH